MLWFGYSDEVAIVLTPDSSAELQFSHIQVLFLEKVPIVLFFAVLLALCSALVVTPNDRTYSPKNDEEVKIVALVLASEASANGWTARDLVCFSVESLDPDRRFVQSIRKRGLNFCSSAEWRKKFNCGFEVQLSYTHLDLSGDVRVRSKVVDLRDINTGTGDLALLQRDGEYALKKIDGRWLIGGYVATLPQRK